MYSLAAAALAQVQLRMRALMAGVLTWNSGAGSSRLEPFVPVAEGCHACMQQLLVPARAKLPAVDGTSMPPGCSGSRVLSRRCPQAGMCGMVTPHFASTPLNSPSCTGWQPLLEPHRGLAELKAWRPLLESEGARQNVLMGGAGWEDMGDHYATLVAEVVMPPIR